MSTTAREIIVDNNDSRINYTRSWLSVDSTKPTLSSTLHKTYNGSLQFDFNGTQIALFGTTEGIQLTWSCFVDISINATSASPSWDNKLCLVQDLDDKPHSLTLNAAGDEFLFDYISYTPSKSAPLDNSLIRIGNLDPDIHYDPGWAALGDVDNLSMTKTPDSSMSFNFTGQSLSWYGHIPTEHSTTISVVDYVVDDQNASFSLTPGSYNQPVPFFQISLPFGPHSFHATFHGDHSSTPLTLAFLLVQNGTSSSQALTPPSSSSTVKPTTSNPHANVNIGAIVGGSLAAIITLLLVVFFFILYRRQRRKTGSVTPHRLFPAPVIIKTHRTVSTPGFHPLLPSTDHELPGSEPPDYHDTRPQSLCDSAGANYDGVDEKASYHGGYQTWGQVKAIEAQASRSNTRDSYI